MIVKGGIIFIRQCDQLPQMTVRGARVVMELAEPAAMPDYIGFLNQRLQPGSDVQNCVFLTFEAWAQQEAHERVGLLSAEARQDAAPGWMRRTWNRIVGKALA